MERINSTRTKRAIRAISLLVFCLLIFSVLPASGFINNSISVYAVKGNIFSWAFGEPVETVIFVANTGDFYGFTNYMSHSVTMVFGEFEGLLEKDGLTVEDIIFVIHNHVYPPFKFSLEDKKFYSFLKDKGFKGLFLLWSNFHQRVTDRLPVKS